jgi:hypothetical protein
MSPLEIFGIISTLFMLASRATYFTSIFKGRTKPHVFSWLIWGTLSSIGFAAQVAEGAGPGSWARGFSAATCFMLVVIALIMGEKNITRSDWITLGIALLTVPLWVMTKTPVWSVLLVCLIDTAGYLPTIRKSWERPFQEAWEGYALSTGSAVFALLAVEHYTLSTWLYTAVLSLSNSSMATFLLMRRRHLSHAAQTR